MDDSDLETRLRAAAPHVTGPVGLADHRQRIMGDIRSRGRRRGRLWSGAAVLTVALVGAGSVAVAGNGMETPWGWTADNVYSVPGPDGQTCFAGLKVLADGWPEDPATMRAAREIVGSIDLETLDTSAREAEIAADIGTPFDDGSPGTVSSTPQEVKQAAVFEAVSSILRTELSNRGLWNEAQPATVSLAARSMGCN